MMSEFASGGIVAGPPTVVRVEDDECILGGDDLHCIRQDDRHHYHMIEVQRLCDPAPIWRRGHCLHRHTEPVTLLTGEVVGHLCLACDVRL